MRLKVGAAVLAAVVSISAPAAMSGTGEPSLAVVRQATERFQDVKVALAEGYVADPLNICDSADMMGRPASLGAMGIHYSGPTCLGSRRRPTRGSTAPARTPISASPQS